MAKAGFEDSSHNVAEDLLAAAPRLLASIQPNGSDPLLEALIPSGQDSEQRNRLESIAADLLRLMSECLKGEPRAISMAGRLIKAAAGASQMPSLRLIAADELLHRSLRSHGDAGLRLFVVAAHRRQFASPELIDAVLNEFRVPKDSALANAHILACRHLLGSTVAELAAVQSALPAAELFEVMGKPYSANTLAVSAIEELSVEVNEESLDMPSLTGQQLGSFAGRHRRIAENVVERFLRKHGSAREPILVIDDGGTLINAVGRKVVEEQIAVPVVAIEQTTHGTFAIQEFLQEPAAQKHGFTVISVADSIAKLDQESPLIAKSVVRCLAQWLDLLHHDGLASHIARLDTAKIGLIGFGPVGAFIAQAMPPGAKVTVFDRNRRKMVLAKAAGLDVAWSLHGLVAESQILIAASGGASLDADAAAHLQDGTILVSASSGDREFSGGLHNWSIRVAPTLPAFDNSAFDRAHGLLTATHPDGRTVYVLNRGFPVNFDGSLDPIGVQDIQLTRALIVGAVLQAAGASEDGSVVGRTAKLDLDPAIDQFVGEQFRKVRGRATPTTDGRSHP